MLSAFSNTLVVVTSGVIVGWCIQLAVHFLHLPEEFLKILHPLEIGNGHAASIGQDVRNHHHSFFMQDLEA